MEMMEDRPPLVRFEVKPVENREASIKEGRYIAKDVVYAVVTPAGSRDETEKVAEKWMEEQRKKARLGKVNPKHLEYYERQYDSFKKGQEAPLNGTSVKNWNMIGPAQCQQLIFANILTIEDLANANDSALSMIGMGAQALKSKAKEYLNATNGQSANAIIDLQQKLQESERQKDALAQDVAKLAAHIEEMDGGNSNSEELAKMQENLDKLIGTVSKLQEKSEALEAENAELKEKLEEEKPKRGRPPAKT